MSVAGVAVMDHPPGTQDLAHGNCRAAVAGQDFTGYELKALWDDATFGLKHWHQFKQNIVVMAWLRAAITMFRPFFSSEARLIKLVELAAAKDRILRMEKASGLWRTHRMS